VSRYRLWHYFTVFQIRGNLYGGPEPAPRPAPLYAAVQHTAERTLNEKAALSGGLSVSIVMEFANGKLRNY
jgi:hypothetical protein